MKIKKKASLNIALSFGRLDSKSLLPFLFAELIPNVKSLGSIFSSLFTSAICKELAVRLFKSFDIGNKLDTWSSFYRFSHCKLSFLNLLSGQAIMGLAIKDMHFSI